MTQSLKEHVERIKLIVGELSRSSCSRVTLQERFTSKVSGGSPATFLYTFDFLAKNGYIKKAERIHRAPYVITERGQKLLEALA